jgi:uncharacterized protein
MPFWTKLSSSNRLRLFFATDVHGSEPTFRKFINAGKIYDVDILVLGGDITGKLIVPIIISSDNAYRASLQSKTYTLSRDDLPDFQARLAKLGFYYSIMSEQEYRYYADNPKEIEVLYLEEARKRLTSWIRLAEERLSGTKIRCYITGGNDDHPDVLEPLKTEAVDRVIPCENHVVSLSEDGYQMISLGYSNPTPWDTPREVGDDELALMIDESVRGIDDFTRTIFNLHVPPKDSTIDTCPMLDSSTNPPTIITSGGEPVLFGAGSASVRAAIERYQPLLSLHGHIHESRGEIKINRTTCINPGSEYGEGILRGVIVSLSGDRVESAQMTSG